MPLVFTQRRSGERSASKSVPVRRAAGDLLRLPRPLDEPLAERVHREEIRAHPFQHDLAVDVDHVAVADFVRVDDGGHLDARAEFAGLRDRAEDAHLRFRQVVEDDRAASP